MPAALQPEVWNARKSAFLEAFPNHGTIEQTCRELGFDPNRAFEWLQVDHPAYDPAFAGAFGYAKESAADRIEQSLIDQAKRGRTAWDTTAAIFLLKGYRPQFRDNVNVNVRQESVSLSIDFADLGPSDKAALLSRLADKLTTRPPAKLPPPPTD